VKPPFSYFGGKQTVAARIAALLPPHGHYVEPFAGSLAVLLAKRPSRMETVNDLDGDLMTFWRVLRDRPADLERACALTPHSRAEHQAAYEPAADELEQARRVWVRLTQGRGGHTSRRTGWRYFVDPGTSPNVSAGMPAYVAGYAARIVPAADRLAMVSLESLPALDLIAKYGQFSNVLIYADPPYLGSLRTWGNNYAVEMRTEDEHRELLEALLGCRSAVVLSGYASPLYDGLLSAWSRLEIATQTGNGGSDRARTEVLWSNRPFPIQGSLFDLDGAASA
jgi:DNA adenine methylase